ncbi:MAG: hypothetical protein HYY30_02680 [Chloroflexi bacterium]|nr:hypothetical protein [Chloroflexota bacterium]
MAEIHEVACPACGYGYYVSKVVFRVKDFACICPKCKHEFRPEESIGDMERGEQG